MLHFRQPVACGRWIFRRRYQRAGGRVNKLPTGKPNHTNCGPGGKRSRPIDGVQRTQYARQTERCAYRQALSLCASALHYRRLTHPRARSVVDRERTAIAIRTGLARPLVDRAAAYVQRTNPPDVCGHRLRRVQRQRGRLSGAARRARPQTWDRDRTAVALLDAGMSVRKVAARLRTPVSNVTSARVRLARTLGDWDRTVRTQQRDRRAAWRAAWRRFHRQQWKRGDRRTITPEGELIGKMRRSGRTRSGKSVDNDATTHTDDAAGREHPRRTAPGTAGYRMVRPERPTLRDAGTVRPERLAVRDAIGIAERHRAERRRLVTARTGRQ